MIGIVALRPDGTLQYANRAARSLASRGDAFALDAGGFHALRACDSRRIDSAVAALREGAHPEVFGINLPRSNGLPDYLMQLRRCPHEAHRSPGLGPALELRILDPQIDSMPGAALLRQLFGLTAAQAALAQRLAAGERHAAAAEALGIRVTTLRAHLTEIYRKTHTANSAQLVRLLMLIEVSAQCARDDSEA